MRSISVVIPAHNEESYIAECLAAVRTAEQRVGVPVEVVVVLNRCTDRTSERAGEFGAVCVRDERRSIAGVRNRGVRASTGDVIVTCDADSRLHPDMLVSVTRELRRGAVGGGVAVRHDRRSAGIRATELLLRAGQLLTRVSAGALWTTRPAHEAIGGFDETLTMGEDVDYARRLRRHGRDRRRRFVTLTDVPLETSARKFDRFGDWMMLRMMTVDAVRIRRSMIGRDTEFVDEYFFEFNDTAAMPPRG